MIRGYLKYRTFYNERSFFLMNKLMTSTMLGVTLVRLFIIQSNNGVEVQQDDNCKNDKQKSRLMIGIKTSSNFNQAYG